MSTSESSRTTGLASATTSSRTQVYNVFNHSNFGTPTLSFPANFGVVSQTRAPRGDASSSRQIEFGLKMYF